MRIQCPFCGDRDHSEFAYLGDAVVQRPDAASSEAADLYVNAVYMRRNPDGPHLELWYHVAGCRNWLRVSRNTRTHELVSATLARDAKS